MLCAGIVAAAVIVLTVGGSSGHKRSAQAQTPPASRAPRRRSHHSDASTVHSRRAAPAPGTLPQTHALPSSTTTEFKLLMDALWRGVVHDSTVRAMPAFFPKAAYLQVKAIADPGADYVNRLVHGFTLDIGAVHALLGAGAATARLVRVNVPQTFAHWVQPGTCYNRTGYYEVPNSRVVYSENGRLHSFGIASMISWRGVWYVVHFGAVLESGVVDAPSAGSGTSIDTGTC